jgi:hypothetical protein
MKRATGDVQSKLVVRRSGRGATAGSVWQREGSAMHADCVDGGGGDEDLGDGRCLAVNWVGWAYEIEDASMGEEEEEEAKVWCDERRVTAVSTCTSSLVRRAWFLACMLSGNSRIQYCVCTEDMGQVPAVCTAAKWVELAVVRPSTSVVRLTFPGSGCRQGFHSLIDTPPVAMFPPSSTISLLFPSSLR